MKLKEKLLISIIGLSTICLIICPITSNAALQANGNTGETNYLADWLVDIRKMETTGGTLGLTDTINTSSLLSTATESNDLDIHMQKNTEYGAMAILSASAYGNQNAIADGQTTTGNKSGVVINLNKEWVSAGQLTKCTAFTNANAKYKNSYTTSYIAKAGDAITETNGWHGSGSSTWISGSDSDKYSGLIRAYSGSIFSYYGYSSYSGDAFCFTDLQYSKAWYTRAVIVVGEDF